MKTATILVTLLNSLSSDADGKPKIIFEPSTTMDEKVKEQLMLAVFTAEAMGKTGDDKAFHITDKLRDLYGSYWTAFAAKKNTFQSYFKAESGKLAVFDYDGKRWNVYEHAHSYRAPGSRIVKPKNYAAPSVVFHQKTEMNAEGKEQLLFAIFIAENRSITGYEKLKYIATMMESVYSGNWSVHMHDRASSMGYWWEAIGYYAAFDYEGKRWAVYKNYVQQSMN